MAGTFALPMASSLLGSLRAFAGSTTGKALVGGGASAVAYGLGSNIFEGIGDWFDGDKPKRRGSHIISKRAMKQIKRVNKYKKEVRKAVTLLGMNKGKRSCSPMRRVC